MSGIGSTSSEASTLITIPGSAAEAKVEHPSIDDLESDHPSVSNGHSHNHHSQNSNHGVLKKRNQRVSLLAVNSADWKDDFEIHVARKSTRDKSLLALGSGGTGGGNVAEAGLNFDPATVGVPTVPDGGYGWVIVFASFMCGFIVDGIANSFGIFLTTYMAAFDKGQASLSVATSLYCGVAFIVGPFVSGLTNKYGCRNVCIAGAITATLGMGLSALATSLEVFIFTYSIIGGVGIGMISLPIIICVGYYFESKRALATGIAVCGSGMGTFLFAPFCSFLSHHLEWRYIHAILAGLLASCGLFGMLMKPLEIQLVEVFEDFGEDEDFVMEKKTSEPSSEKSKTNSADSTSHSELDFEKGTATHKVRFDEKTTPPSSKSVITADKKRSDTSGASYVGAFSSEDISRPRRYSFVAVPVGRAVPLGTASKDDGGFREEAAMHAKRSLISAHSRNSKRWSIGEDGDVSIIEEDAEVALAASFEPTIIIRPLARKDIFYSGDINHLTAVAAAAAEEEAKEVGSEAPTLSEHVQGPVDTTGVKISEPGKYSCLGKSTGAFTSALGRMMHFSLLINPIFLVIGVSNFFFMCSYYMPYVFLVDVAVSQGVSKNDAAFLVSIIGIANTIGRIISGFISYIPQLNALWVYIVAMFFAGVAIAIVPLCHIYYHFVLFSIFYGLFTSFLISLTTIVLVDLLGLENLTNAFGLVFLLRGTAVMCGVPAAGAIFDVTKSYSIPFYLGGGLFILASLTSCMIPVVEKCSKGKSKSLST